MNLFEAFGVCLATMFSGLLLGLAYLLYQHKFMDAGV